MSFRPSELDKSRIKVALRNESYTWVSKSQDFVKGQGSGFSRNQEKAMSQEITLLEVGFSPTRVNLCLRACVCVSKGGVVPFFPSTP